MYLLVLFSIGIAWGMQSPAGSTHSSADGGAPAAPGVVHGPPDRDFMSPRFEHYHDAPDQREVHAQLGRDFVRRRFGDQPETFARLTCQVLPEWRPTVIRHVGRRTFEQGARRDAGLEHDVVHERFYRAHLRSTLQRMLRESHWQNFLAQHHLTGPELLRDAEARLARRPTHVHILNTSGWDYYNLMEPGEMHPVSRTITPARARDPALEAAAARDYLFAVALHQAFPRECFDAESYRWLTKAVRMAWYAAPGRELPLGQRLVRDWGDAESRMQGQITNRALSTFVRHGWPHWHPELRAEVARQGHRSAAAGERVAWVEGAPGTGRMPQWTAPDPTRDEFREALVRWWDSGGGPMIRTHDPMYHEFSEAEIRWARVEGDERHPHGP